MTNREIEEKLNRAVRRETPDVLDRILCGEKKGIIEMTEQIATKKRRWTAWAAGIAAALLLAAGGGVGWNYALRVDSVIAIDVNPSVELRASQSERVLSVRALNEDAAVLLEGMELKGVQLEVAVNALIGSMVRHGYIDEARNSVLVSVEGGNPERNGRIQNEVADSIHSALQQYTIPGAVLKQAVDEDEGLKTLAERYGISAGRASLVRRLTELDPALQAGQLAELSVNDLSLLLLARQPDALEVAYGEVSDGSYIGLEKARQIALAEASGGTVVKSEFDYEDGRPCYEVKLTKANELYAFDIDAVTGAVLKREVERSGTGGAPTDLNGYLGTDEAARRAFAHAGVKEADASSIKVKLEEEDGRPVYEVEFTAGGVEYDYELDAVTGEIRKAEQEHVAAAVPASPGESLSEAEAKELALSRVSGARLVKWKLDTDDGRRIYEGKLTKDGVEYEFKIDAATGDFLKWEEETQQSSMPPAGAVLSEAEAKELALSRVSGARLVKWKLDTDDGRRIYEGKLTKDGMEYEFEIDAATGDFLKWEEEMEQSGMPSAETVLSEVEAKELALSRVSGARLVKWKLDTDDGRRIYEGRLTKDGMEYEFEIDAVTGDFLKWEEETED